jgi:Right handed beta helix region
MGDKKHNNFTLMSMGLILAVILLLGNGLSQMVYADDLFVKTDGTGTACTQGEPCSLQTALTQAIESDTVYVATGAYTGTGDNVITITQGILLYGGWDGSPTGPVVLDPETYPTTLDGENSRRVIHISGTISPTIDGFIITKGNATGLTTDCTGSSGTPGGCGGGLFVYQASPTISNNEISNNVAAVTSTNLTGYGGGVYIRLGSGAEITNNTIMENDASQGDHGAGGGLCVYTCGVGMRIEDNRFRDNYGTTNTGVGWGGGIHLGSSSPLVQNNIIQGNVASSGGSSSQGSGLYQWYGAPTIRENLISENQRGSTVYLGYSSAIFETNYVVGNNATTGVQLVYQTGPSGPTLQNNIITGTGGTHTIFINGHITYPLSVTLNHNTLVGGGADYGVYIADYATVSMINNIVTGHTDTGIYVSDPGTSAVSADHTLFYNNTSDGERGTNPVVGDPVFANPAGLDYHIKKKSAAIDTGVDAGVTTDIDNDTRPLTDGYDIGADEYNYWSTSGDELALDFGASGLWDYDGTNWDLISGSSPEDMAGWSGGLAMDFGASGVWSYDGAAWSPISGSNPEAMVGWSEGLAMDFGASGLWNYDGSTWTPISGSNVEDMADWANGLSIDFGASGVWNCDGTTWALISGSSAEGMLGWSGGLAMDFGASGLWNYDGSTWALITGSNVEDMDDVDLY